MPYKPKHCCQCGEKIDRVDWKPWTSRRFCQLCETELGVHDWAPRILIVIGLLFGLYGIGSYFQKPDKQLNVATNQLAAANPKSDVAPQKIVGQVPVNGGNVQSPVNASNSAAPTKLPLAPSKSDLKTKASEVPTGETAEKVYFCGAPTRKGTMCSRRVKNGGRCWQHTGQAALLPQEKLLAVQ